MIRTHNALMRQAREFFARELAGLYAFDRAPDDAEVSHRILLRDREELPEKERRERRQGRYREQIWFSFGPWDLGIFSAEERPPIGALILRQNHIHGAERVNGPLDPATWADVARIVRSEYSHQPEHQKWHFSNRP